MTSNSAFPFGNQYGNPFATQFGSDAGASSASADPRTPNGEFPGFQAMTDPLGFMKRMWGASHVPAMMPPMSEEELDKKIQDLKTVESWLSLNLNMLRGTIQTMEVQRATLGTLKTLGENFAQHARQAGVSAEQMSQAFSNFTKPSQTSSSSESPAESSNEATDQPPPPEKEQTNSTAGAWWGGLQEQFRQAVTHAMVNNPILSASTAAQQISESTQRDVKSGSEKVKTPTPKTSATKTVVKKAVARSTKNSPAKTKTKASATATTKRKIVSKDSA